MRKILIQLLLIAVLSALVLLPMIGLRIGDSGNSVAVVTDWPHYIAAIAIILGLAIARLIWYRVFPNGVRLSVPAIIVRTANTKRAGILLVLLAASFPFLPFTDRYLIDVASLVMTYILLGWGLNLTIGRTGLLDLGYVAFYALGAYTYALLALDCGFGFWLSLPLAMSLSVVASLIVGIPTLRLRGDYFAIATLGFAQIVRICVTNWQSLTGGPNGLSRIPRPSLFGLSFERSPAEGITSFYDTFGLDFDPQYRVIFLYYIALGLVVLLLLFMRWLRLLPLGRAFEAVREDEIAAAGIGINVARIKIASYALSSAIGALAGAYFAARQGFVSPESFTFMETAVILAVVVLGGAGSSLGIVLSAILLIGVPELFRELQEYRMLAFGIGMVVLMIWRPGGLFAARRPTVLLGKNA